MHTKCRGQKKDASSRSERCATLLNFFYSLKLSLSKVCSTLLDLVVFEFVLKKKIQKKGKNWEQIAADFRKKFPLLQSVSARSLEQRYKVVEEYWNSNRETGQVTFLGLEATLHKLRQQRIKYLQYIIENINLLA